MMRFSRFSRLRHFTRRAEGQALVEYALILPIFLAILVGIIEMGRAWNTYQVVTHSAREGARYSVLPTSTADTTGIRIREIMQNNGLETSRAQLDLRLRDGTGTLDTVRVAYQYQFFLLGGMVRLLASSDNTDFPGSVRLTSTSIMRNE